MNNSTVLRGVIHGKMIELDQELGLPEGQAVQVTVQPVSTPTGEGLKKAFGAWSDEADELDEFLDWNRNQRKQRRREIKP